MTPFKKQQSQSAIWECCICYKDHGGNGRPPASPWAAENNEMVCERCIGQILLDVLRYETSWPARWGAEVLDIMHFQSILPDFFVNAYNLKERLMQGRRALPRTYIPEQVLGVDYQLCPCCTIALYREVGSNHVMCTCGASLCFTCGNAAFDRPGGYNHWSHGGCPRYGTVGSGHEKFDNGQYNNREPHLVPLGRVFGVLLYVNGDDEHLGKPYKHNPELCWQTCNHEHDIFNRRGEKYPPFHKRRARACSNFNVAMQETVKAPHISVTLRRLLDRNSAPITTSQRQVILNAMSTFSNLHSFSAGQWKSVINPNGKFG